MLPRPLAGLRRERREGRGREREGIKEGKEGKRKRGEKKGMGREGWLRPGLLLILILSSLLQLCGR